MIRAAQGISALQLAGLSAGERTARRLATYDSAPLFVHGDALPDPLPTGPCLWLVGLFPFLPADDLAAFLDFARARGEAVWHGTVPGTGLVYSDQAPADPAARLRDDAPAVFDRPAPFTLAKTADLGAAARLAYAAEADRVAAAGALLLCPEQTFIEVDVAVGPGTRIAHGVTLAGRTRIGAGVRIDAGACLTDVVVANDAHIKAYSVLEGAEVGAGASVGPFAHVRPGSRLGEGSRVGNFVETKNTVLGTGSKASHLTYLGDAVIGDDCNIGAGTITCNYDGFNKSRTTLGNGVFIGSNSQLVAPVTVGDGGYVAAGSTIVEDVPADALAIGRSRQTVKPGLARKIREKARHKKEAAKKS